MAWRVVLASMAVAAAAILLGLQGFGSASFAPFDLFHSFKHTIGKKLLANDTSLSSQRDHGNDSGWDIRYHMGGNSEWIPKVRGAANESIDPPEGCYVDQVHMVLLPSVAWQEELF
jgi:hypothetical protein